MLATARPAQYVLVAGGFGSLLVALAYVPGWAAPGGDAVQDRGVNPRPSNRGRDRRSYRMRTAAQRDATLGVRGGNDSSASQVGD